MSACSSAPHFAARFARGNRDADGRKRLLDSRHGRRSVAADNTESIPTGSTACATNPNDKCCYSCTTSPPSGCANGCPNGTAAAAVDDGTFQSNLRCWQQKRRFGYDFCIRSHATSSV